MTKSVYELARIYESFFMEMPKLDNLMSALMDRPVLDLNQLDDFLHRKFGGYEESGLSMEDVLKKEYGRECLDFVREAFCLQESC